MNFKFNSVLKDTLKEFCKNHNLDMNLVCKFYAGV